MENQKLGEFRRDEQCTFFANWLNSLERIIDADNMSLDIDLRSTASYRFLRGILNYSLYDVEPDFKHENQMMQLLMETLWIEIVREIEASLENRAKSYKVDYLTKDKRKIIETTAEMIVAGESASNRAVSMRVFGSETRHDTVRRVQSKYQNQINTKVTELRSKATQESAVDKPKVFNSGNGGAVEIIPESEDELPF